MLWLKFLLPFIYLPKIRIVKARKLGVRSKIFLFSKTVQDYGNRSADICLLIQTIGHAGHSLSLCVHYNLYAPPLTATRTIFLLLMGWPTTQKAISRRRSLVRILVIAFWPWPKSFFLYVETIPNGVITSNCQKLRFKALANKNQIISKRLFWGKNLMEIVWISEAFLSAIFQLGHKKAWMLPCSA